MDDEESVMLRVGRLLGREPLVLFAVLGAVLYGVWVIAAPGGVKTVRIEAEAFRAIETQQAELVGRDLTEEEREEIREGLIDDEVLLAEALKRGLQYSDGRTRRRLTRIMRGALTETVADPSVAQLQAYFRDNIDRFTSPESVSLEQVFFPWGEEVADDELVSVLDALRSGADAEQFGGSSFSVPRVMPRQSRVDLVRAFGAGFADWMEQSATSQWGGPVESTQGLHLVRITDRHHPEVATFEEIENYLRQDWIMAKSRELQQKGIDEIRARYEIEIVEE